MSWRLFEITYKNGTILKGDYRRTHAVARDFTEAEAVFKNAWSAEITTITVINDHPLLPMGAMLQDDTAKQMAGPESAA